MDLPTIWFILVGVLFTGYVMLDGFDLGVGGLHLFVRKDEDRRIFLNAIGPVWDGNEVWLVTGGGALFAAFPEVYATVFSGFYDAFMLLLFGLIFRAVAIEFRSKQPGRLWRGGWDTAFAIGSLLSSLLIGVAMGNVIHGVPLNENHEFMGTILTLLNPYSLMVGVFTVSLFLMHGNIYLILKTEGELQQRLLRWVKVTIPIFLVLFAIVGFSTPALLPHIGEALARKPIPLILFFVLAILLALNIPREVYRGKEFRAFPLLLRDHGLAHDPLRGDRLPEHGLLRAGPGELADHRERFLHRQDPRLHVRGGPHRRAHRHRLHGVHLLHLPREGEAGRGELLSGGPAGRSPAPPAPRAAVPRSGHDQPPKRTHSAQPGGQWARSTRAQVVPARSRLRKTAALAMSLERFA